MAELSGGELTVKQFPGGALNSVPSKQYAILLDGVADIIFTIPGYNGDVFPMTPELPRKRALPRWFARIRFALLPGNMYRQS